MLLQVVTKSAAEVSITALLNYVKHGGIDLPQDAIQALDIALRHSAMMEPSCIPVARSLYFFNPNQRHLLEGDLR